MNGYIIAMIAVFSVALIVLIVSYICFVIAFRVDRKETLDYYRTPSNVQYALFKEEINSMIKKAEETPFEDITVLSKDGLTLHARYYETKKGAPFEIQFHGYKSAGIRDFCGGLQIAKSIGHNVIIVDQRAHGKSEGKCLSFGVLERFDCLCWINYTLERFGKDTKIILAGVSMGAATVMMSSDLALPENVAGIIADCGYSSPKDILFFVMKDNKLPARVLYPFIKLGGLIFGGFNIDASGAEKAVKNSDVPLLIIHGEDDRFVPHYMAEKILSNCACKKRFLSVPGAGHALSYFMNKEKYIETYIGFCNDVLK